MVVMPDADIPKSVDAIMSSAFGAAGERCLAGSVLVAVGEVAEPLLKALVDRCRELKIGDPADTSTGMGPLVTKEHRDRVASYIDRGISEGAIPLCNGREGVPGKGAFLRPTVFDHVTPGMSIAREEIFGPVLAVIRAETLDAAIELINNVPFGNTTTIYTASGKSAREFATRIEVGMVGVNMAVAAPMAFFPFSGWKQSFFGDLHAHGKDAVSFYTEQKVVMSRWF
jgi:malonate-semialdehyde dehydrogenase (acetylating) / methylmalonate-semialdehyde dehydrogenase